MAVQLKPRMKSLHEIKFRVHSFIPVIIQIWTEELLCTEVLLKIYVLDCSACNEGKNLQWCQETRTLMWIKINPTHTYENRLQCRSCRRVCTCRCFYSSLVTGCSLFSVYWRWNNTVYPNNMDLNLGNELLTFSLYVKQAHAEKECFSQQDMYQIIKQGEN